ncbi:MAG: diphosphomevalonate/mevalonate 3,5-bisphosphate decarboxylase family protein [Flavobacteriales bacterium]
MTEYIPRIFESNQTSVQGEIATTSPSNIALIKYWGKMENQIPANPSVSYTLSQCRSYTNLKFKSKKTKDSRFCIKVFFEGNENETFSKKIHSFFSKIVEFCPYLYAFQFEIQTRNTFPHSSGIASSASGMSALALCLVELEKIIGADYSEEEKLKRASFLARLGSGSASRSIYKGLVLWGKHPNIEYSSNLIAQPLRSEIHPIFKKFNDTVLIVHKGQKTVSSTQGHNLMHHHAYAEKRFEQAFENISKLQAILQSGDLEAFGELVESEALTLHAMMMTSVPYFILMQPNTLEIINKIWDFRKKEKTHLYFTLDAGANVHLLYPEKEAKRVHGFIQSQLKPYCEEGLYIHDQICF